MASLKQRLRRKNADGSYDTIYLQADLSNVTGTLAVVNGGTGATSAADARSNLGLGNVDNTADSAKSVNYATGADTVDGIHGYELGTLSYEGGFFGQDHHLCCKHNLHNDGRFGMYIVSGYQTRVDYATYAAYADGPLADAINVRNVYVAAFDSANSALYLGSL